VEFVAAALARILGQKDWLAHALALRRGSRLGLSRFRIDEVSLCCGLLKMLGCCLNAKEQ
jgi:hypothetical protein